MSPHPRIRQTFTIDQVAEDLASPFLTSMHAGDSIVLEVACCPDLAGRPRVKAALDALVEAQNAVAVAAAIEARDRVAAWLAYSEVWRLLDALDDVLVLAGVRREFDRYDDATPTADEWTAQWKAYVASGAAWKMRTARGTVSTERAARRTTSDARATRPRATPRSHRSAPNSPPCAPRWIEPKPRLMPLPSSATESAPPTGWVASVSIAARHATR